MTEPSNTVTKFFYVSTAAPAAVTGLTIGNFLVVAVYKPRSSAPVAWTHASALVDLGTSLGVGWNGWYAWTYTMPAAGDSDCAIDITPTNAAHFLRFAASQGELEPKDLLSIYNAASKPVVTINGQGTIGQITPITLINKRYRKLTFTFVDSNGANIDMTAGVTYTNYVFGTRSKTDQTATPPKADQTTGIVGGNGYVEVTILEAASFFNALTEGASVQEKIEIFYELTADLVAVANETVPLVQSSLLTIYRREVGT